MNEKRTEQRKINLNFLILLAFIAVLGKILILFVPVTGTGDREFVPTVMIAFAIGCLIGLPILRAQKGKNTETPEQPASTRALATGALATYAVLLALAMIYSRSNHLIASAFLLSAGIVFFCSSFTQMIYSRKK